MTIFQGWKHGIAMEIQNTKQRDGEEAWTVCVLPAAALRARKLGPVVDLFLSIREEAAGVPEPFRHRPRCKGLESVEDITKDSLSQTEVNAGIHVGQDVVTQVAGAVHITMNIKQFYQTLTVHSFDLS